MSSQKVMVTGGAGFIGSNLVDELVAQGHDVYIIDDFSTGQYENLSHHPPRSVKILRTSILKPELYKEHLQGVQTIFHHAAIPSVPRSVKDPLSSHDTNVTGTLKLLLAAKETGVKRIVYASSSSIYGDQPGEEKNEELQPRCKSPYGFQKFSGEEYMRLFNELYGMSTISLRYFNVFGPRQDPTSAYAAVIPLFINSMMNGNTPTIYGDGTQTRDFTFVANNVHANILAMNSTKTGHYNIACNTSVTLNNLVTELNNILGTRIPPHHAPERQGDIKHSKANIEKAKKELGYEPTIQFSEGLQKTVEWYKNKKR